MKGDRRRSGGGVWRSEGGTRSGGGETRRECGDWRKRQVREEKCVVTREEWGADRTQGNGKGAQETTQLEGRD